MIKTFFKALAISSVLAIFYYCDSDKGEVTNSSAIQKSYPEISKELEENLRLFAENHVRLNNQILLLLEDETNAKFDNFPYDDVRASEDEGKLQLALADAGVNNYMLLSDLLISQSKNGIEFKANNEEFTSLKEETQQSLVRGAITNAVVLNPIIWTPEDPGNDPLAKNCYQQFIIDRNRCNETCVEHGSFALMAFIGGPVTGGLAVLAVAVETNRCLRYAREDYADCRNGK